MNNNNPLDPSRLSGCSAEDEEVSEITSLEDYDKEKAKFRASVLWVLSKAYNGTIPHDQRDLFFEDQQGAWYVKPQLMNLMTSGELYCSACANIFQESPAKWHGHSGVIQSLSRKGIYVEDENDSAVTETALMHTAPFRMVSGPPVNQPGVLISMKKAPFNLSAHMAMIDALMKASIAQSVSIEKVVQSVRKFTSMNASSELPYDAEDALLFWANKVCQTVKTRLLKQWTNASSSRRPVVPEMEDLKDVSDGCCLAVLLHFYVPDALKIERIVLEKVVGIADAMHNFNLVKTICDTQFKQQIFHTTPEDLLFLPSIMKVNLVTFLADLFYLCEVQKADCVKRNGSPQPTLDNDQTDGRPMTAKKLSAVSPVQISNATKKSFQKFDTSPNSSDNEINKTGLPARQAPLLPRRHEDSQQSEQTAESERSSSLPPLTGNNSRIAWEETRKLERVSPTSGGGTSKSQSTDAVHRTYTKAGARKIAEQLRGDASENRAVPDRHLLTNVSIDSELSQSFDDASTLRLSQIETPRDDDDGFGYRDEQTSSAAAANRPTSFVEPLMPAKTRPSKEKNVNHSKEFERGDKRAERSPPAAGVVTAAGSPSKRSSKKRLSQDVAATTRCESSSDDEFMTPVASDPPSLIESLESTPKKQVPSVATAVQRVLLSPRTGGEAFYIDAERNVERPIKKESPKRRKPVAVTQSFTRHDRQLTPEEARAAGLPVIGQQTDRLNGQQTDRSGEQLTYHQQTTDENGQQTFGAPVRSGYESQSSSDFSDHESSKIHRDHRSKESAAQQQPPQPQQTRLPEGFFLGGDSSGGRAPTSFYIDSKTTESTNEKPLCEVHGNAAVVAKQNATNFSSIKKQPSRDNDYDNSAIVLSQHSHELTASDATSSTTPSAPRISLKSQFHKSKSGAGVEGKPVKKTTFAALPNQTTWQENVLKMAEQQQSDQNKENNSTAGSTTTTAGAPGVPVVTELSSIRLKLEQKRRAIESEKRKMEQQMSKERQKLGKQAFFQVVAKSRRQPDIVEEESDASAASPALARDSNRTPPVNADADPANAPEKAQPRKKFSREDIQATIEGVKNRWFKDDESVARKKSAEPPTDSRMERAKSLPPEQTEVDQQTEQRRPSLITAADPTQRRPSADASTPQRRPSLVDRQTDDRRSSTADDGMNVDEYSTSLEKLNSSLSELQGEIMKLSLQQEQIKMVASTSPKGSPRGSSHASPRGSVQDLSTRSPPEKFYMKPAAPSQPTPPPPPRQEIPQPVAPSSGISPPHPEYRMPGYTQPAPSPYMHHGQQFAPDYHHPYPPASHMGQYPPGMVAPLPGQPGYMPYPGMPPQYQHAPHMYQATLYTAGRFMPGQPYMPPQAPTYAPPAPVYTSNYQPNTRPHATAQTYTVNTQQMAPLPLQSTPSPSAPSTYQQPVTPVSSVASQPSPITPVSAESTPPMTMTQQWERAERFSPANYEQAPVTTTAATSLPSPVAPPISSSSSYERQTEQFSPVFERTVEDSDFSTASAAKDNSYVVNTSGEFEPHIAPPGGAGDALVGAYDDEVEEDRAPPVDMSGISVTEQAKGGLFIEFELDAPRKPKPKLRNRRPKSREGSTERATTMIPAKHPSDSSPMKTSTSSAKSDRSDKSAAAVAVTTTISCMSRSGEQSMDISQDGSTSGLGSNSQQESESAVGNSPAIGLYIGEYHTHDEEKDADMQKKREKFVQLQLKRKEELERKRVKQEADALKKRELRRKKEEQAEQKKAEEKARREQIYQQYLQRKMAEDEDGPGASEVPPKTKFKSKKSARPQSMPPGGGYNDKYSVPSSNSSQEDLHHHTRGTSPDRVTQIRAECSGFQTHRRRIKSPSASNRQRFSSDSQSKRRTDNYSGGDGSNAAATSQEYSGPKLFVKPRSKSNRNVIINAISHVCLAGSVNNETKNRTIDDISKSEANHFLILFRDSGCQYRAVYTYNPETEDMFKLTGNGPKALSEKMMERFYKYNSGSKSFSVISSTKHMSVSIDAVTISNHYWQSKKSGAAAANRRPSQQR
ncbi:calmodulin-regulated spectrin-associated protein 1-like [Tubulanus polymorphus]|uniref:calmodulin-regulated spectrin-associated protein 1-like n=1 Tax=Tubulanus polymorphus TaxID=672921 RepID=UPI003DA29F8B